MALELKEDESGVLKKALEHYLGNLREEIVKTEKVDFKRPLKREEEVIKEIIKRLS
jgi:hypothetical protein